MKKVTAFVMMTLAATTLSAAQDIGQAEPLHLTLDRAIEIALADNPSIKVAEQDVQLKEMAKLEQTMALLPEANLSGSYQRTIEKQTMVMNDMRFKVGVENMYSGGLSVSLPVFAPALYKSMNLTRTDVELAMESARASKQDLVCQVTKAFYQQMLAQDSYEVLQKSLAQSEENYRIVSVKYNEGRVSEYDKISAEVQMRNLKPSVISARNAVDLSKLQLKVLMGVTANVDIVAEGNLKDYEEQMYATMIGTDSLSLRNNSSLLQMDLNRRLLKNTLDIQNQSFLPNVALQFNYMYTCMADNFDFANYNWNPYSNVALSISIPLFKYSNFSAVKKTRVQMSQLEMNRDYAERQLQMQMDTYLKNMNASAEQVSSNKEAIIQAQKGRDIAQTLYDVGRGTVLELNSAEVALTQSELTYSQSVYDWLTAKADLDKLLGQDYMEKK